MNKKKVFCNYSEKAKWVRRWKNKKGNWIPKKKRISDLDKSDQDVYQNIVEDFFKNYDISKDEITKQIKKKQIKNKKNMFFI